MGRVVITDSDLGGYDIERAVLKQHDVDVVTSGRRSDVLTALEHADVALVQWEKVDAEFLDAAPRLRAVVRYGMGLDNVDLDLAAARQIAVRNVDDFCLHEVAEHATAMILAAQRRLWLGDRAVRRGEWGPNTVPMPKQLADTTVGLAGFGRIGRLVGTSVAVLGAQVVAWDPFVDDDAIAATGATPVASLVDLAERSDVLSLHTPLDAATRGLVDHAVLEALGADGHLVNVGRGGLVDEQALIEALRHDRLGSASLDVLDREPPAPESHSHEIANHPRVLVTPHIAYLSERSLRQVRTTAANHALEELQ